MGFKIARACLAWLILVIVHEYFCHSIRLLLAVPVSFEVYFQSDFVSCGIDVLCLLPMSWCLLSRRPRS